MELSKSAVCDKTASQLVLSKNPENQSLSLTENYAFWQIPNFMANPKTSTIDLLIQKDPLKKKVQTP